MQTAHTTMLCLFNLKLVNEIVEVSGFDPNKLGRLRVLELRGNKLMTTVGLSNLPNLKELYMVRLKQLNKILYYKIMLHGIFCMQKNVLSTCELKCPLYNDIIVLCAVLIWYLQLNV